MSEASVPHRVLHLIVEGFPPARLEELAGSTIGTDEVAEIFELSEASAREALEKIFAAATIAVWGGVSV